MNLSNLLTDLAADAVKEQQHVALDERCQEVDTDFLIERFWIVVVFGVSVSIVSVVENLFVFTLFVTSKQHRNSNNLYLMLLAFFDVFMGISYILLMSVNVAVNYTRSYLLRTLWAHYVVPMLTISHIAMTTSSYLITFAAVERYAITVSHRSVEMLQRNRRFFVIAAFLIAFITKGTFFFEVTVVRDAACAGAVREWGVEPGPLARNAQFSQIWRFYFRTISTIFAPFFILLYLNLGLVARLRQPSSSPSSTVDINNGNSSVPVDRQFAKQKRARIRAATRTLVILVGTYLFSNLLNVIVTIWEYIDVASLFSDFIVFYVLSVDAVSLLTICSCALRLPIYMSCQPLLRKEMIQFIGNFCHRREGHYRNGTLSGEQSAGYGNEALNGTGGNGSDGNGGTNGNGPTIGQPLNGAQTPLITHDTLTLLDKLTPQAV